MKIVEYITNPCKIINYLGGKGYLRFVPDKQYLKCIFFSRMGKKLNLQKPETFNEKLQWLKLYDRKTIYNKLVDKYEVRKYITNRIGGEYLIPLIGGPWESFDEINFNMLPKQFVLKCTHDSGGIVVCRDKNKLDIEFAKKQINDSLKRNYYWAGREWPYKDIKPKILAEKYMGDKDNTYGLVDYKFFCCNGEPKMLYVSQGLENHTTATISFLKLNWTFQEFKRKDYKPFEKLPAKPLNYNQMIELAKILSKDFIFIRVDLYEINGRIYFSELTFTPCSGMIPFDPPEWDKKLGSWIKLPEN